MPDLLSPYTASSAHCTSFLVVLHNATDYSNVLFVRYEGVCMSFLTQLNAQSYPVMFELIKKFMVKKGTESMMTKAPASPGPNFVQFDSFWVCKDLK